jgi:ACS family D-galactonate transporter-like MFS transporter
MATTTATAAAVPERHGLWNRELEHYPTNRVRYRSLGIVTLATVVLYYQLYLQGALGVHILSGYHMSFAYFVNIGVASALLGAVASIFAGMSDRYGRANIVSVGLVVVGLLCLLGVPNAHSSLAYGVILAAIGFVEGIVLVATPALVRDFSPQLGRASAMALWTLGPVLGSLVVSIQVSNTEDTTPWQDHYVAAGIVGLVVGAIALVGLRELGPRLRDQLMVSKRDRALLEARAKGIDVEAALKRPFRQMFKLDIVASAFAVSVFLLFYFLAVAFFPVFFQTVFGYSQSKANGLGNWFWACDAIGLLAFGLISDLVRVRKPFMLAGAVLAVAFTSVFAVKANDLSTGHTTFVVLLVLISLSLGLAYSPWMASFTETIERRNPALTATGLAVWGLTIRLVLAASAFFVPHVVNTVTTLVDKGQAVQAAVTGRSPNLSAAQNAAVVAVTSDPTIVPKIQAAAAKYPTQLATAAKIDPTTAATLAANPIDRTATVKALSDVSGVPVTDVTTVLTLRAEHPQALQAGLAIDPGTAAQLLSNPSDPKLRAAAVNQLATRLHVTPAQAQLALAQLASIPPAQLLVAQRSGAQVAQAATSLAALATAQKHDPATFALLARYGAALRDPKVVSTLKYLQVNGPAVQKAAKQSPGQWQKYWWLAVGGEIVFIPFIFVMAGFWDPRNARAREREHVARVQTELDALSRPPLR